MLRHKTHYPKVPPVHLSAAWIAHNAGMAEKRKLLSGQRPKIGSMYKPRLQPEPAIHVPRRDEPVATMEKVRGVLCIIGFVTVMYFILTIGAAVGF